MRALLPILLLLGACASTDSGARYAEPSTTEGRTVLGPQTLETGECGLFGWDARGDFVFFATEGRGLYAGDEVVTLQPRGEFPELEFEALSLELGPAEVMIEGRRYTSARVTETLDDGFTRLRPLTVIEACQTDALAT